MADFNLYRTREQTGPDGVAGTEGVMYTPDDKVLMTLERSKGDPEHPCIPAGKYRLTPGVMASSGHQRALVNDVPGRDGIFIHNANYPSQLKGCIAAAAQYQGPGKIGAGMADFVDTYVISHEDCWLVVHEMGEAWAT